MTDVLIYGDTVRDATLRHEIPLGIGDAFLYLEAGGKRAAVVSVLERDRVEQLGLGIELIGPEELGADDLLAQGLPRSQVEVELAVRAAQRLGIKRATVPPAFLLAIADRLREAEISLVPDAAFFAARRRIKGTDDVR
jgi:Xaa-Pro aminopeptidase